MSDIIDQANDRAAMDLALALQKHQRHDPPLPYTGHCYNCGVPLPASMRYCDKMCCDDYEKRKRMERIRG